MAAVVMANCPCTGSTCAKCRVKETVRVVGVRRRLLAAVRCRTKEGMCTVGKDDLVAILNSHTLLIDAVQAFVDSEDEDRIAEFEEMTKTLEEAKELESR